MFLREVLCHYEFYTHARSQKSILSLVEADLAVDWRILVFANLKIPKVEHFTNGPTVFPVFHYRSISILNFYFPFGIPPIRTLGGTYIAGLPKIRCDDVLRSKLPLLSVMGFAKFWGPAM